MNSEPDYEAALGIIKHLSSDELRELINNESKLSDLIKNLPQMKNLFSEKEMLLAANKSLAEYNLSFEPKLAQGKQDLLSKYEESSSVQEEVNVMKQQIDKSSIKQSPETILLLIKKAAEEIEEETEGFAVNFLILIGEEPEPAIEWLKRNGLLKQRLNCKTCGVALNWTKYSKTKDRWCWKCQNKDCSKYKSTTSIREGSWFSNSNISLPKWIHLLYLWSIEEAESKTSQQTGISKQSLVNAYASCREICARYLQANPIRLGGPGIIIEIDESCFSHKPKHHRGRAPTEPALVFGIVDTSVQPVIGFMELVECRDAQTLLPIIQTVVQPGSIIHSDEWRAYRGIQGLGFQHQTVNHSVNFVEPNGVHTQHIESYWHKHKQRIKEMMGCKRDFLHWYLQEFMWRDRFNRNAFNNFCEHIKIFYPM